MSVRFVATALSYCVGRGKIVLKGRKRKPWLILRRGELEHTYLDHQLRRLRREAEGPVEADWDVIEGQGFYDDHQLSVHCDAMQQVYDLLYPRDEFAISADVLRMAGMDALVALWADRAIFQARYVSLGHGLKPRDCAVIAAWMNEEGIKAHVAYRGICDSKTGPNVHVMRGEAERLYKLLYPSLHRSIRTKLRYPGSYRRIAPKKNDGRGVDPGSSDFCRFPELATEPPCA